MSNRVRHYGRISEELYNRIHCRGVQGGVSNTELAALFRVSEDTARRCTKAETYADYKEIVNRKSENTNKSEPERESTGKKEFTQVLCVESGAGFIEGHIYAMIGWNKGNHVLREAKNGDVYELLCCDGGYGRGLINTFDNTGCPSFDRIADNTLHEDSVRKVITRVLDELAGYLACTCKE